jgi:hypothetical protein
MNSNVSLYPFDPARDEYFAYECKTDDAAPSGRQRTRPQHVYGQIPFEVPWFSVPDLHGGLTHISLEEIEREMELAARLQEH